jgi:hypothetical protein
VLISQMLRGSRFHRGTRPADASEAAKAATAGSCAADGTTDLPEVLMPGDGGAEAELSAEKEGERLFRHGKGSSLCDAWSSVTIDYTFHDVQEM